MDNIPVKLDAQAVPEFNYFVDNQVLTAGQLNTLTDYFDRQHRLTRARLIGAGIVSGLEISQGQSGLVLGKGVALTSDGDMLIVPENRQFARFRSFTDSKAKYPPWTDQTLLELVSDDNDQEGNPKPVGQLPSAGKLVAVLYLESYLRPPEDCTDTDCDNLGPKQMNRLHVLLLPEAAMSAQVQSAGPALSPVLDVAIRRVKMGGNAILGSDDLGNRFEAAMDASADDMRVALQFAAGNYGPLMNTAGFGSKWIGLFNKIAAVRNLNNGVQYAYAAMKDLAEALRETQAAAAALQAQDFLMPASFPKHVALGKLSGDAPAFRQNFVESPKLNRGDLALQRLQFCMQRIDLMLRSFNAKGGSNGLRVTPSRPAGSLGDRAIPAYFQSSANLPLHEFWNFDKSRQQNTGAVRSYHASAYSTNPATLDPLSYAHDDCAFYRVEGILGLEKDGVLQTLTNLRNSQNLPFRVESVQIEQDTGRIVLPPRFKFPLWENAWHFQREGLFDQLQLAKDYATKLESAAIDAEVPNDSDVRAKVQGAKNRALEIKGKLDAATQALYVNAQQFSVNYAKFKAPYVEAIRDGFDINADVQQFAQTPTESPLHQFTVFNQSLKLDRLMDIFNKKIDAVKRQLIFDNFQNNHPGMEYSGGVPVGGTLVVVHQNDRVVAEFSLPYAVEFDLDPEIDVKPPQNGQAKPPIGVIDPGKFTWVNKFHLYKDIGFTKVGLPDLTAFSQLNLKVDALQTQLNSTNNFVTTWLPNISKNPGTVATSPGGIKDLGLATRVTGTENLGAAIKYLETQPSRTAEQDQLLAGLRREFDKEIAGVVGYIAQNNLEVNVDSDAFNAMTKVNNSVNTVSDDTRNNLNLTKDLRTKDEITKNQNLNILLTGFKLRT